MRSISFASRPISDRGLAWWAGNRSMIKCSPCSDSRQTCIATRRKYEPRHKALRNVGTAGQAVPVVNTPLLLFVMTPQNHHSVISQHEAPLANRPDVLGLAAPYITQPNGKAVG